MDRQRRLAELILEAAKMTGTVTEVIDILSTETGATDTETGTTSTTNTAGTTRPTGKRGKVCIMRWRHRPRDRDRLARRGGPEVMLYG